MSVTDEDNLFTLIEARANLVSVAEIMSTVKLRGGLRPGLVYTVHFQDTRALCRRVYHQKNPLTGGKDSPVLIQCVSVEEWTGGGEQTTELLADMNRLTQVGILICIKKEFTFTPVFGGVFDLPSST
jgi:hypothetical protein